MIFCFFDTDAMEERRNWSYWAAMFSYNVVLTVLCNSKMDARLRIFTFSVVDVSYADDAHCFERTSQHIQPCIALLHLGVHGKGRAIFTF